MRKKCGCIQRHKVFSYISFLLILLAKLGRQAWWVLCLCGYSNSIGLGSNIGRGLFVGWVGHPDIFCWVSFLYPTYLPAIFVLSAKPNKMAEDRIIPVQ
jgi:hypothetical protein